MKLQISVVFVLSVAGVLSRSVDNANVNLLPVRGKCGVQVGTFSPPPGDGSGAATGLAEFPWLALLSYSKNNDSLHHSCSGSLINERYVLTAAHCVSRIAKKHIGEVTRVRLGEYNIATAEDCVEDQGKSTCAEANVVKDIDVESIIIHPEYNENRASHNNDIALIRLKDAAPYTDYIRPVCLPLGDEQTTVGQNLILSGWDRDNKDSIHSLKQKASLPFISSSDCQSKFTSLHVTLSTGQMCAGGKEGVHSCIALGGSPLMAPLSANQGIYIEGIVSFGPTKCAVGGVPDVFTKVVEYVPWVLDNMKP